MRKLFWIFVFVGIYFWLSSLGEDSLLLQRGKEVCRSFLTWFEDTEIEFNFKKEKSRGRSRRWD